MREDGRAEAGPDLGRTALVPGRRRNVTNGRDNDEHDNYRPGPGLKAVRRWVFPPPPFY